MDSSVLYPPNSFSLSDDVIGVKPRARKQEAHSTITNDSSMVQKCNPQARNTASTTRKMSLNELLRSHPNNSSLLELVLLGKRMERKQWRENKSQYRKKYSDYVTSLEESNRQLQQELQQFEQQKSHLRSQNTLVGNCSNIWSVAIAYFTVFRNGLVSKTSARQPSSARFHFIQTKISPAVVSNGGSGTVALLQIWRCLSLSLQNFEMELEGLEKESPTSMVATTRTSFTLTKRTVGQIFPHLLDADSENEYATLLQQLMGKDIVVLGRTRFEWNHSEGYVTSIMAQSDFLTPVLRLVGTLENASRVFENSRISPDFA